MASLIEPARPPADGVVLVIAPVPRPNALAIPAQESPVPPVATVLPDAALGAPTCGAAAVTGCSHMHKPTTAAAVTTAAIPACQGSAGNEPSPGMVRNQGNSRMMAVSVKQTPA